MKTNLLRLMPILLLALPVTLGAGAARNADAQTSSSSLEQRGTARYAQTQTGLETAQTTDPLVEEGKAIELQTAAAVDWIEITKIQLDFQNWLEKVVLERQKRNDPGYVRQREESIATELARTLKIRMEKDTKVCRQVERIEIEMSEIKRPYLVSDLATTQAWNKQFATNVLKDIAFALNKCWEWQGKVSGLFTAGGVEINIDLNVVFRPVRDGQTSLVTYNMAILDELGLGFNQPSQRCQYRLTGQTTITQGVKLGVDFEDYADNKLSYFGLGSSIVNTNYECNGKSVPQGFPLIWLFTSSDGKLSKAVFVDNPSNKQIKGSVSSKGMTAAWDLQRQAPKN